MKKPKTFRVGDKVFAKVKGYPPWPAKVTGINGKKYNVEFFGTKEIGQIKAEDLVYYVRNREKFGKSKRAGFPEAIEQIDEAVEVDGGDGDDNPDESSSENNLETSSNASFSSLNSSITDKRAIKRKRESTEDLTPAKKPGRPPRRVSRTLSDASEVTEQDSKQKNEKDVSKKEERLKKIAEEPKSNAEENTKVTEPEFVAIKNDTPGMRVEGTEAIEDVETNIEDLNLTKADVVSEQMLLQTILFAEHVFKNEKVYKRTPVEKREDTQHQFLAFKTPNGRICGIKLHLEWPLKAFENEYERTVYDNTVAKRVLADKASFEKNPKLIAKTKHVIKDVHLTASDIKAFIHEWDIKSKDRRVKRLKIESHMISLESKIKNCLGLDTADPKAAILHLQELMTVDFDALMLKKHPHVVEMARRLRKYVGNTKEWDMTDKEIAEFKKQAEEIRNMAEKLYLKIKGAIGMLERIGTSFWDGFQEILSEFREKCRELTEAQIVILCAEPLTRTAFIDNLNEAAIAEKVDEVAMNGQASTK